MQADLRGTFFRKKSVSYEGGNTVVMSAPDLRQLFWPSAGWCMFFYGLLVFRLSDGFDGVFGLYSPLVVCVEVRCHFLGQMCGKIDHGVCLVFPHVLLCPRWPSCLLCASQPLLGVWLWLECPLFGDINWLPASLFYPIFAIRPWSSIGAWPLVQFPLVVAFSLYLWCRCGQLLVCCAAFLLSGPQVLPSGLC